MSLLSYSNSFQLIFLPSMIAKFISKIKEDLCMH